MQRLTAPRILSELFLHEIRSQLRRPDGTPVNPTVTDPHAVPQWDEDTSYLGEESESVNLDAHSLSHYLMRDDAAEDLATRQAALDTMEVDDDRLMAMLAQVGGGSWN